MPEPLIPIIQKAFDFNVTLYGYVNKFPRAHKALLGREILRLALELVVLLVTANHRANKVPGLQEGSAGRVAEDSSGDFSEKPPRPADRGRRKKGQAVRYTMTSPKVEAYLKAKLEHPDKIVLVKTGVFYKTFFEDATFCHKQLHLQVQNLAAASEAVAIPSCGMPIGNLTSQLFANLYLDPLDHFMKEELRCRHYLRYMDDFVVLGKEKAGLWEVLEQVQEFLRHRFHLRLNLRHTAVRPFSQGVDFLGYVIYPESYKRVRRRNVVNVRHRVKALEQGYARGEVTFSHARSSIASWLGVAKHASAFRLSRRLLLEHDVRNIGKRLLVKMVCQGKRLRGRALSTAPSKPARRGGALQRAGMMRKKEARDVRLEEGRRPVCPPDWVWVPHP